MTAAVLALPRAVARASRVGRLPGAGALLLGLGGALALCHGMLADPAHRLTDGGNNDPAQATWFLGFAAHAVSHGTNPLLTDYLQFPTGVNLMWNASMPLLGLLASPVTLTLGPVVAYNLLMVLALATTTWTARLWLGRHVDSPAAATLGGLLVAFSPYAVGQLEHHLGQAFLAFLMLALLLLEDLLWRRPRPAWRSGALLGLAVAAQALVNEEVVLIAVAGVVVALLVAAVQRPRAVLAAVRGGGLGWPAAAGTFLLVAGWPLWVQTHGARGLAGIRTDLYVAEPRDWVLPTTHQLVHWGDRTAELHTRGLGEHEIGGYLGWAVPVLVIVVAVALWRRFGTRVAVPTVLVTMLLSLGPRLRLGADRVGPPLPWAAAAKLPGFAEVLPVRLSLATFLALGWLVAVGADAAIRRRGGWGFAALAGLVAALVPVLPARLATGEPTGVPSWFGSAAAARIPAGTAVLPLPYARPDRQQAMLWIATDGVRLRLVGGAAKRPGRDGQASSWPPVDPGTSWARAASDGRRTSPAARDEARSWLLAHRVRYLLLADAYAPPRLRAEVSALVGTGPRERGGGVSVWRVY